MRGDGHILRHIDSQEELILDIWMLPICSERADLPLVLSYAELDCGFP